jgi:2-polyprenyl-3-methyl-5-hydroxy-6-metoxy-1,4-benzoquinol methylase
MKESEIRNPDKHKRYLELVNEDAVTFFGDTSKLEETCCPACGVREFRFEFRKFGFNYGVCESCRTLYVNPRPKISPLTEFYINSNSSRYWVDEFFKPVAEARREKIFKPRAKHLAELLPSLKEGKIGDIGAGFGLFLEELRLLWPDARFIAIEPSPEMADICRAKLLGVEERMIENVGEEDGAYDVLTAFELLEHLHTPATLIRRVHTLLRPGGYFLATTLSGEGFDIQILWDKSRSVFPPHHLNFLNPSSLGKLLKENGFEIIICDTPGMLDWQILEGSIERGDADISRFWKTVSLFGSDESKNELQSWIKKHGFSSHMRVLARKI